MLTLAEAVGIPESGGIQALRWYLRGERIHRTQQRDQQAHRFALMAQSPAEGWTPISSFWNYAEDEARPRSFLTSCHDSTQSPANYDPAAPQLA